MTPAGHRQIITVADAAALAQAAAKRVVACIAANPGRIAICLTGGSTAKQLYQVLASDACRSQIPWQRVHWFVGDDRFVRAGDPLHNMSVARQSLLDLYAPAANVHSIPTDAADPNQAARRYERELKSFYGADQLDPARPLFDIVLLGVGPDGHVASIFPDYPAGQERERWVTGVPKANVDPFVPRVTLTFQALNSCREMLFQIAGSGKRAIMTRILAGEDLPANHVHAKGATIWLMDETALPENFRGQ